MPNLKIERDRFDELMGHKYSFQQLDVLGFEFGIEVEQDNQKDKNGNIIKHSYKFDCMNNRPDLLTEMSLIRAFRIYMKQIQIPQVRISKPTTTFTVDPSVKNIRPFIAAAILRDIKFDENTYKAFIAAQQKLHDTFCRARKYASIGTHDLDTIKGPFRYEAKEPTSFQFIPLNQDKKVNGLGMMQLFENHKLKQYLHLIRDSPVYPLVVDANEVICSVPPIINGEHSKISIDTKNILIEVTALSRPKAMICLNTIIWGFSEYCAKKFEVEAVQIIDGQEKFITPAIDQRQFTVIHQNAENMVGGKLNFEQIQGYLKRTGLKIFKKDEKSYTVKVPFWRGDVLHEVDILEDIAICYGYTKIKPVLPSSATIGSRVRINKYTDFLRHQMAQAQYNEVLNFALCSKADLTTNMLTEDQSKLITISNAKTKQFQTGRTTLLPGLLRTIIESKANALPYKLFEAGDCIVVDPKSDTGAGNVRKISAVLTDEVQKDSKKGIFSILHGSLDIIMKKSNLQFGKDYKLNCSSHQFYFPGQQFDVELKGEIVGSIGVIHPKVLNNFGWGHPTVMWELNVEPIERCYTASYK